jgi:flagellar protein FlaG
VINEDGPAACGRTIFPFAERKEDTMGKDTTASVGGVGQQLPKGTEQIDFQRKNKGKTGDTPQPASSEKGIQSEELLSQIKAATEDGLYSVRFELNDNKEFVAKIYDQKTDKAIRQIPAEELLKLKEALSNLAGNIVDTQV